MRRARRPRGEPSAFEFGLAIAVAVALLLAWGATALPS